MKHSRIMKHSVLPTLLSLSFLLSSCIKDQCRYIDQTITANNTEIAYIQSFLAGSNITNALQHPSGVFYTIDTLGAGLSPNLCSTILVTYDAYRFGYGNAFDSYNEPGGIPFVLGTLITGVQKVLPLIKQGGQITMYIPPSLAYGNQPQRDQLGNIILPANSYIKFRMSLVFVSE